MSGGNNSRLLRVNGLDTWRFVAATLVVLTHSVVQPDFLHWFHLEGSSIARLIHGIYWKYFFTGSAGVIVFFLISGFCIHHPYLDTLQISSLKSYFVRRISRIGLPLIPIVLFYLLCEGLDIYDVFSKTVLWSVACEVIYYILYPFFLYIRRRAGGWKWIIGTAFAGSVFVALSDPTSKSYWSFGPEATWLLGLPCWLLGAALAEDVHRCSSDYTIRTSNIWLWRLAIWSLAALAVAMTFRGPLGDPWTLTLFSVPVYFWLKREISYFRYRAPVECLEKAGGWSYSVYITHTIIYGYWKAFVQSDGVIWPVSYLASLAVIFFGGYLYYRLIERPTHKLSRRLAGVYARK